MRISRTDQKEVEGNTSPKNDLPQKGTEILFLAELSGEVRTTKDEVNTSRIP